MAYGILILLNSVPRQKPRHIFARRDVRLREAHARARGLRTRSRHSARSFASPPSAEKARRSTRAPRDSHHAHRGPQREVAPGSLAQEHRAQSGFDSRRSPAGRAQGRAVRAAELPPEAVAAAQRGAMVGNVRQPPGCGRVSPRPPADPDPPPRVVPLETLSHLSWNRPS